MNDTKKIVLITANKEQQYEQHQTDNSHPTVIRTRISIETGSKI